MLPAIRRRLELWGHDRPIIGHVVRSHRSTARPYAVYAAGDKLTSTYIGSWSALPDARRIADLITKEGVGFLLPEPDAAVVQDLCDAALATQFLALVDDNTDMGVPWPRSQEEAIGALLTSHPGDADEIRRIRFFAARDGGMSVLRTVFE